MTPRPHREAEDQGLFQPQPPAEELDWAPALAWLPTLETSDFSQGSDLELAVGDGGVSTISAGVWSDLVGELTRTLYETNVVAGFDWPAWMQERGRMLRDDPAQLDAASLEDCRRLLTAAVRADRFVWGGLFTAIADGQILAILRRVATLVGDGRGER